MRKAKREAFQDRSQKLSQSSPTRLLSSAAPFLSHLSLAAAPKPEASRTLLDLQGRDEGTEGQTADFFSLALSYLSCTQGTKT